MTLRATHVHARAAEYQAPGGPWDLPPLGEALEAAALREPDRVLLVHDGTRLDGNALAEATRRVAGALAARGVGRGDVVAWQSPNRVLGVLLLRACWHTGAVAAPLHHHWGASDADRARAALGRHTWVDVAREEPGLLDASPVARCADVRIDDLAALLCTAGSSGTPKWVLHSHATLACKARTMADWHGLGPDDAVLMPAPLAHVSGLLNGVTLPGTVPFTTVLMSHWDPARAIDLVERQRITFMVGPPTFFVAMMRSEHFDPDRVASMRLVSSGGAGVTESFVAQASEAFGCLVKRTYGSTEAPTVATSRAGDDATVARRRDGRAVGAVELRVVDASGDAAGPDETGELHVRGPEVCCGYLDPAQTEARFTTDGWYRTGDVATLDGEGWLTILGRLDDVIIRGGENIAAAVVEEHLAAHPLVRHAVAVGYPDDLMGERVCAFVVADADLDVADVRAWFRERGTARYVAPEQVVRVVELPTLPTGKPDRVALRAEAAARFGVRSR